MEPVSRWRAACRPPARREDAGMPTDDPAPATEPEHLERLFVERANAGDVDGLVALFQPDAVMVDDRGRVATGEAEIRRALAALVASGERLTLGDQRPTLRVGDVALTSTRLAAGGVTAEVARRRPDGTWRWVIDRWSVLGDEPPAGP
jgi:ketosteroid isomerase-like protein